MVHFQDMEKYVNIHQGSQFLKDFTKHQIYNLGLIESSFVLHPLQVHNEIKQLEVNLQNKILIVPEPKPACTRTHACTHMHLKETWEIMAHRCTPPILSSSEVIFNWTKLVNFLNFQKNFYVQLIQFPTNLLMDMDTSATLTPLWLMSRCKN